MTKTEHDNRTRKAIAIADRLQAVDCDADTAARLTDAVWQQAAHAAAVCYAEQHPTEKAPEWTDASEQTRAMVITLLVDRDRGRFERADSLHPTSVVAANAHDTMADVIEGYVAVNRATAPADQPSCDHPQVAYCDECDPDPITRQHEEMVNDDVVAAVAAEIDDLKATNKRAMAESVEKIQGEFDKLLNIFMTGKRRGRPSGDLDLRQLARGRVTDV